MIATLADYRRITHDYRSYDGDVAQALTDASAEFTNRTGRIIELGTYTESLPVYDNGQVYPLATPITSVSDPADVAFDEIAIQIHPDWASYGPASPAINYGPYGYGGYGSVSGAAAYGYGYDAPGVLTGLDRRPGPWQVQVTYVGGYATPPADVVRCICEMAVYSANPNFNLSLPAGTKAVTLGDQSISGSFGSSSQFPASVTSVLNAYARSDL